MKKYFGIALLILLNGISVALTCFGTFIMFGFQFIPLSEKEALEVANTNSWLLIGIVIVMAVSVLFLNFLIFKKMIHHQLPKFFSAALASLNIMVFIPLLIKSREIFMDYHKDMGQLKSDVKGILDWLF
jgi:glucan phosphoethanolaminetransferase (alkaline phosphatase superfamily)